MISGLKNFSVPDIIKLSLPTCVGLPEYAAALKVHMKNDGIHFKASGYVCIAAGLSAHMGTLKPYNSGKKTAAVLPISGARSSRKQTFYWRGFVSPVGVGRPFNHKAAYLQNHPTPSAGRGGGGGKWKVNSCEKSTHKQAHFRTPYGGPRGRKR
jgi:hypothetical protein